ncbi:Protein-tyrosine phosphatase [Teladorsagia circumcincta]|uniref:Protein-tyrosine phosphatase n=1 Tax=Teladorsagia circumcincta TaxID=45464 RepID=A0A2G9UI27_TELCI|nr:Protein-tyrosine phosphatase [Teladorsagia circumcincta]
MRKHRHRQTIFRITSVVSPMSEEDYFVRVSKLKLDYKDKDTGRDASTIVHHYQWENWPDRGVPQTKFTAINLLARVRNSTGPVIVHCSAGIGRTGTIVAISYVTEKMQNGEDCLAMSDLLKEIRTQRPGSIQNEFQYLYIHRVLLAYFLEKYRTRFGHILENGGEEKYRQWCADYKQATGCD